MLSVYIKLIWIKLFAVKFLEYDRGFYYCFPSSRYIKLTYVVTLLDVILTY